MGKFIKLISDSDEVFSPDPRIYYINPMHIIKIEVKQNSQKVTIQMANGDTIDSWHVDISELERLGLI